METAGQLDRLYMKVYGPLYLSTVLSTGLYGITCMQTFFYYVHYQSDPFRIKSFVATIWGLNTVHEALIVIGVYKCIIAGLADPKSTATGEPELIIQILFTALVAIPTQGFFVYRIYVFSGRYIVVPLIWVPLAIFQLVSTATYVVKALYSNHGIRVAKIDDDFFMSMAVSCLSVAAAVDIMTAVCLTFLLFRKRAAAGYSNTAHILQRLTVFAVNTGIWTATFALLSLIFLHIYPANLTYTVFAFPLCSIYCNTLLANLNVREYFRDEMATCNTDRQASERCESHKIEVHVSQQLEYHGVTSLDADRTEESENV